MSQYKLIINADDFGLSESVNYAICESFVKGYITNTTLMVNMPYAEQAVKLAKEHGFWDRVGLHMNLYEGSPLNENLYKYENMLFDKNGQLKYWSHGKSRFILPSELSEELKVEMQLQLEKFLAYEPLCLHVDSHGHSHTNLSVWKKLKPLLIKYGIESTRISRNLYVSNGLDLKDIYKKIYNKNILKLGLYSTDLFGNFEDMYNVLNLNPDLLNQKSVELMCHPDYKGDRLVNNIEMGFEDLLPLLNEAQFIKY